LYEWLDISDRAGEAAAFFDQIAAAITTYRRNPARHTAMLRAAMAINASWESSARQYIDMYRYGLLVKQWYKARQKLIAHFTHGLAHERELFATFFVPGRQEYGDRFDWELKTALDKAADDMADKVGVSLCQEPGVRIAGTLTESLPS